MMDGDSPFLGRVTHVIDPDNFSMQVGTDESFAEFLQFEQSIDMFGRTQAIVVADVEQMDVGQVVLVDCTDDNDTWRRGQVARVNSEERYVDVVYIDYGSTELVEEMRLCSEFPEEFMHFPAQAIKCQLAGIKPLAKSWTTRAVRTFIEITHGKAFYTFFIPSSQMFQMKVALYTQEKDRRCLSHMMMDQELGLVSDEVPEFYEDAAEFFKAFVYNQQQISTSEDSIELMAVNDVQDEFAGETEEGAIEEENREEDSSEDDECSLPETSLGIIPEFDFGQIHHTKDMCTDRLEEKKASLTRKALKKENARIMEDVKELRSLASKAGYGDVEHQEDTIHSESIVSKPAERSASPGKTSSKLEVSQTTSKGINEDRMPIKRYSERRRLRNGTKPTLEERLDIGTLKDFQNSGGEKHDRKPSPRGRNNGSSPISGSRSSPSLSRQSPAELSRQSPHGQRQSPHGQRLDADFKQQDIRRNISPYRVPHNDTSSQLLYPAMKESVAQDSSVTLQDISSNLFAENDIKSDQFMPKSQLDVSPAKQTDNRYASENSSPEKREDLILTLNRIFAESEKDTEEETRVRLQSLFYTDVYMYLDKEQLGRVIYSVLNRAVRYYDDLHDVLLDIIQTLSATEDFGECLYESCKKIEENYIKVQFKGSTFHVQASKILAHLFQMSTEWNCRDSIQEIILTALEKWIIFNKTAHQLGQDRLQEIYIECFDIVWCIVGTSVSELYPDVKSRLHRECRDKVLNENVSKLVRSKLLDIYTHRIVNNLSTTKVESSMQTDWVVKDQAIQTDMIKITGKQPPTNKDNQSKLREVSAVSPVSSKHSQSKTSHRKKEAAKDIEWPKLASPKMPEWTAKLLDSKPVQWSSPEDSVKGHECLMTPESFDNSLSSITSSFYYSADECSFQKSDSSLSKEANHRKTKELNDLSRSRGNHSESNISSGSNVHNIGFTNWSDNMGFKSNLHFSAAGDKNDNVGERSVKSRILQDKLCEYAPEKPGLVQQTEVGKAEKSNTTQKNENKTLKQLNAWHDINNSAGEIQHARSASHKQKELNYSKSNLGVNTNKSERKKTVGRGRGKKASRTDDEFPVKSERQDDKFPVKSERQDDTFPVKSERQRPPDSSSKSTPKPKEKAKEFDWFSMKEIVTEDTKPVSVEDEDVPDDWYLANIDDDSAKNSVSQDSNKISQDSVKQATSQESAKQSISQSSADDEISKSSSVPQIETRTEFQEEQVKDWFSEGNNVAESGTAIFMNDESDDEDDDDFMLETESSEDDSNIYAARTKGDISWSNSSSTASTQSEKPSWVPGQRKCTLCGDTAHLIYDCPKKGSKNFFL